MILWMDLDLLMLSKKEEKKPNLSSIPCNMRQSIGLEPVVIDQSTHLDCEAN
jgi:hypothetical protein